MTPDMPAERRLAAILATDVVGFSRLMEADEEGTFAALQSHRAELIDPKVAEHRGRIVKTTGDGALIEFPSVVDAVRCALDVQRGMAERNAGLAPERLIAFRVGINVGDVILDAGDIYGDGVNVAARLESMADPGGICISGAAYDHVAGKVAAAFDDLGPQTVKNIARPIRVLRVTPSTAAGPDGAANLAAPVPGFQGRPAIAVLPLENMSGDPEQEFFADGIAEDILTRLAMWRWCPIIARNSSFAYKGKNIDLRQVGRELGARYLLEGSIRKAGDRVRITGQLIDAETGHHVWAERYDRRLDDIFAVQDEIVDAISVALEDAVGRSESKRASVKTPASMDAWELHHRGMHHLYQFTPAAFSAAREAFSNAVEGDPHFAPPAAMLALLRFFEILVGWNRNLEETIPALAADAQRLLALDSMEPTVHVSAACVAMITRRYEDAETSAKRAIELNPSNAQAHYVIGPAMLFDGRPQEAIEAINLAIRLSPNDSFMFVWLSTLAASYYMLRDYETSLRIAERAIRLNPKYPLALRNRVSCLAQLGRLDEARQALVAFVAASPGITAEAARAAWRRPEDADHYMDGLYKAGWTE